MASVSSLDQDMRKLRLGRYTPEASQEVKDWIGEMLGEPLKPGNLLDALKDGTALCKLINLASGTQAVRFKASTMPFVQMENISHFLRACQAPPFNLPPHDVFLTVDLYEKKDPTQVVQCIGAFSRKAHILQPGKFPRTLGPKSRAGTGAVTPQDTGSSNGGDGGNMYGRGRGPSNASDTGSSPYSRGGTSSPSVPTSSYSKKTDEGVSAPAWNIHQYGYMGGASQGNQGISFGGRRQITTPAPKIPSMAEKERKRREEEEAERLKVQAEEAEHKRRVEREAEEERDRVAAEQERWAEETKKQREKEKRAVEEEKRRWEAEERKWKEEEEARAREEKDVALRLIQQRETKRTSSDARLTGQYLSQYRAERGQSPSKEEQERHLESARVKDLERQLQEAKERERQYERERLERFDLGRHHEQQHHQDRHDPHGENSHPDGSHASTWRADERDFLRKQWSDHHPSEPALDPPASEDPPPQPARPLPQPSSHTAHQSFPSPQKHRFEDQAAPPTRPLPNPSTYTPPPNQSQSQSRTPTQTQTQTDQYPPSNPTPINPTAPKPYTPSEASHNSASEASAETARRLASQQNTKAGGWASKSLLEREMERERQRQQEWEEAQNGTREAARKGVRGQGNGEGLGPGESWDVNQYGYLGGENQGKSGVVFGARRQIIGPRPPPGG